MSKLIVNDIQKKFIEMVVSDNDNKLSFSVIKSATKGCVDIAFAGGSVTVNSKGNPNVGSTGTITKDLEFTLNPSEVKKVDKSSLKGSTSGCLTSPFAKNDLY